MYLKQTIAVVFAAICPLVLGQVSCNTSGASPSSDDAQNAINDVAGAGYPNCNQGNGGGSDCTAIATSGSAAVSFCGAVGYGSCTDIANAAQDILDQCTSNGLAGGTNIADGNTVELFNSADV
jgi:hypothetical protein